MSSIFPRCTSICADASKITGKEIRSRAGLGKTTVDVVFGLGAPLPRLFAYRQTRIGRPSQRFASPVSSLLVVELDSNYFVFENVKGLTIGEHRKLLDELIEAFYGAGYDVLLPYSQFSMRPISAVPAVIVVACF